MTQDAAALDGVHTEAGFAALHAALQTGTMPKIASISFGYGTGPFGDPRTSGAGYEPSAQQTELRGGLLTVPIGGVEEIDPYTRIYQALVPAAADGEPEFFVHEVGFVLEDGTLFAVHSHPGSPRFWRGSNSDIVVAYTVTHQGVPADSVGWIASGPEVKISFEAEFAALREEMLLGLTHNLALTADSLAAATTGIAQLHEAHAAAHGAYPETV